MIQTRQNGAQPARARVSAAQRTLAGEHRSGTRTSFDRRRSGTFDGGCRSLPIPLAGDVLTTLQLLGSGFRILHDRTSLRATAGGIEVPVLSAGPASAPGNDQVTIGVPNELIGAGEVEF